MPKVKSTCLTPPELAKRWRVKPESIIRWIRKGELRAFDVSKNPGTGRPRYRIPLDAVVEFENRRSGKQVKTVSAKRRKPASVIEFFR